MEEYKFERLSKSSLFNLVYLYKECFKLKVDLNFLEKKYNTLAFGAEYIGFLAFEKNTNEVAGYYGVFPMQVKMKDKNYLVAQSGDTMTHPDHQGKGLFTQLAKATYQLALEEGIHFVFGFPNKNSYPGFKKKLEWQFYNEYNHYIIKTGALPFDKVAKKFDSFAGVYAHFISNKLKNLEQAPNFVNSLEQQNPQLGFINHDEFFFKYKTFYKSYTVKINNIGVTFKIDGRFWVGDVESCSKEEFFVVVNKLSKLAKSLGCSTLHFSVTQDTSYDNLLKKKFTVESKHPIGYLSLKNEINPALVSYDAIDFDTF